MVKIVSLVENTTKSGFRTAHGLSLYIETRSHKLLFDVGGDDTFIENAVRLGVNLKEVDIVIISHGHRDHGGGLDRFMEINDHAQIYIQRRAFAPHYSHRSSGMSDIGLDLSLMSRANVVLLYGDYKIDDELTLFKVEDNSICRSSANALLYEEDKPDCFDHEHNLLIRDGQRAILIMGCGHNGVVNIMQRAESVLSDLNADGIEVCVGGFHLTAPSAGRDEPRELIDEVVARLEKWHSVHFYTCHCTGLEVYKYMRSQMENIEYLSCGETLDL